MILIRKKLIEKSKKCLYDVLIFFMIFAFPVIPFFSSAKIVMFYVLGYLLLKGKLQTIMCDFLCVFKSYVKIYFFVFFYTLMMAIITMSFEWTLVGKVISSFILYFISFSLLAEAKTWVNIPRTVVWCFFIQSVLILLAIFSESFYTFTQPFRAELSLDLENSYGRLRGNAICGYQFFGIASMYTFVIVYLFLHIKNFKWGVFILFVIGIAAVCSGRFSIVGFFIAFFILLLKKIHEGEFGYIFKISICLLCAIVAIIFILYSYVDQITDPVMYKVISFYLIDPIDSVLYGGSFQSSSTDALIEMYKEEDITKYFIGGAGRYQMPDGHYFGGVDIGYYRMLGYYGIGGFIIITYAFYYLVYRTRNSLDIYTKHAFLLTFMVLNIKGDVQVFNNNIVPILVAFLFFSLNNKTKDRVMSSID